MALNVLRGYGKANGFIKQLPSEAEIHKRINGKIDKLTYKTGDGERMPFVCVICDEFILKESDMNNVSLDSLKSAQKFLKWSHIQDRRRPKELEDHYKWNGLRHGCNDEMDFLMELALSPRAHLEPAGKGRRKPGFKCCHRCDLDLFKGVTRFLPRHAILNKNYISGAPECLRVLNEVELAFLTPLKNYGYCFTWKGGKKDIMRGSLSFMKVNRTKIADGIAHLNSLGLNKNVVCLYSGNMTRRQKQKAEEQSQIRLTELTKALRWLIQYNERWQNVDYEKMLRDLEDVRPVVLDRSKEVESEDTNIEETELFTVFYPDGATTQTHGGFEDAESFKDFARQLEAAGFDAEFQFNVEKEYFKGTDSDLLLDSCLLQFPYGIGSQHEARLLHDGSFDENSTLTEFLEHLSRKSDPIFQRPMMQLIMYSMLCKTKLLRSSRLQLRGKTDAENLACGLNKNDVVSAITGRRQGSRYCGTDVSRRFLDAVDATAKALPHTNQSTKVSRGKGEAMQHHFGMGSIFCTTTFDDENSFLMQVLSGEEIDDDTPVEDLTDEECSKRCKKRRELRLKYPGLAAMTFEMQLRILMSEVIGWDIEKNCPTGKMGFFGEPYALLFAVEEQGRNTLHVHMIIWIKWYNMIQQNFFHGKTSYEKEVAESVLRTYHEHCTSTEFFPKTKRELVKAFDHVCDVPLRRREPPQIVTDQELRNLRNKLGFKDSKGKFAQCRHCHKSWSYEELVCMNLRQFHEITDKVSVRTNPQDSDDDPLVNSSIPKARCFAMAVEYQKSTEGAVVPKAAINAAYQHHVSCHVPNCFKCQKKGKKKRKHTCGPKCECRYHLPDCKRSRSEVYGEDSMSWFLFDGTFTDHRVCHLIPKRNEFDLCQNVACNAVSQSKFACNSNVSVVTEGPVGQYTYKYPMKDCQEEEEATYADVERDIKRMSGERVHQNDRAEALRKITRAAFAHNRGNIISGPFASYFLRNDSRFYFSHEFTYCPLRDTVRLLNNQGVRGFLMSNSVDSTSFFENLALNYLCRHEDLDEESLRSFTERYDSRYIPKENDEEKVLPFQPSTRHFKHPSVLKSGGRKGQCSRGSKLKEEHTLVQVSQWMFPDTANFGGDILNCALCEMNNEMESYAELVLCLFLPLRCKDDILSQSASKFRHTHKLQEVYRSDEHRQQLGLEPIVFTKANIDLLQNIQNARSNSLRFKMGDDELTKRTQPYVSPNQEGTASDEKDDEEEDVDEATYEDFA
jgi:Helitron helicase-like domain at N-terminus